MVADLLQQFREKLQIPRQKWAIYIVLYLLMGILMNNVGIWTEIARFTYLWQIITCYVLYMIPLSLVLRDRHWTEQYAFGVVGMGCLEFLGYALGTSIAYDNNILDMLFTERNFSLGMTLFFGFYIPFGNWAVDKIESIYEKSKT